MNNEPQPATKPARYRSDGPLGGLLNRIPLQSRLAVSVGVVVGIFASVIAGGLDDLAGQIALGIGIGGGVVAAVVLAIRSGTDPAR